MLVKFDIGMDLCPHTKQTRVSDNNRFARAFLRTNDGVHLIIRLRATGGGIL
jgi:predicted ABC-type exoprotein transport system permease subunit